MHRVPAGWKLACLVVLSVACAFVAREPIGAALVLAATLLIYLLGGIGVREWSRQLWRVKWLIVLLVAMQAIFLGWAEALTGTVRIIGIVLLAAAVTLTTPTGEMLDVIEACLAPLRRIRVDPARIAFTIALTITIIPVIAQLGAQIRDAQRARGVRLGVRWIVTLLAGSLRHADDVGDAMTARGIA
jgi:biotin transport system permease protein